MTPNAPADRIVVRAEAVAAYLVGEGSYARIAERFGMPAPTLKSWVAHSRAVA